MSRSEYLLLVQKVNKPFSTMYLGKEIWSFSVTVGSHRSLTEVDLPFLHACVVSLDLLAQKISQISSGGFRLL